MDSISTILDAFTRMFMLSVTKKRLFRFTFFAVMVLFVSSCGKTVTFDGDLIVGKWVTNGTEYWRYDSDGNGVTWDEADDVHEDEAQPFSWEFEEKTSRLTQIHHMEMGGEVVRTFTITKLNETTMSYKNNLSNVEETFLRVK